MRAPTKRVWQQLLTNVQVPKRLRSGPQTIQSKGVQTLELESNCIIELQQSTQEMQSDHSVELHSDHSLELETDPTPAPAIVKMKTNKKRDQWLEDDMKLALEAIASKRMSIRQAGEYYGTPPSSIQDWKKGKTTSKIVGHQTYLTKEEEQAIVEWCFAMQQVALCVTLNMLKYTIKSILENSPRKHPFKQSIPGTKWWTLFKQTHLEITLRCADGLEVKRALGFSRRTTTAFYKLL